MALGMAGSAGTTPVAAKTTAQTPTLGTDVTFTTLSFASEGMSGNVTGGVTVQDANNLITAGVQASGLITNQSGQVFGLLGTAVEFNGNGSQDAQITFSGSYNGELKAGLGLSGSFVEVSAVTESPSGTQESIVLNDRRRFGAEQYRSDFQRTQTTTLEAGTQYLFYVSATLGASAEVGTATADFGPQIGGAQTPSQGVALDSIDVNFQ